MGFPITRRKSPENAPDVMPKDPINTQNVSATVGRVENVFLRVDNNPILTYIGERKYEIRIYNNRS